MRLFRLCASALVCVAATVTVAQDRATMFQNQLKVLDRLAVEQHARSISLQPPPDTLPPPVATYQGRYRGPYLDLARQAARRYGVPEDLFLRLVQQESGWNPQAVSHKGAIGLAQLMPATARDLGVDPRDPAANLDGGARYLRMQFDMFGNWPLALAAYNAGPGAVTRHKGIPPYAETQTYVASVWGQ